MKGEPVAGSVGGQNPAVRLSRLSAADQLHRYPAMPLVIPKSGAVQYVRSEEVLGEILGHSNFDGEDWAIGDRIIFEDGTEARIKQEPGEQFHVCDDPTPADFVEVKRLVGVADASDWLELFKRFEEQSKRSGCASSAAILLIAVCVMAAKMAGLPRTATDRPGGTVLVTPKRLSARPAVECRSVIR